MPTARLELRYFSFFFTVNCFFVCLFGPNKGAGDCTARTPARGGRGLLTGSPPRCGPSPRPPFASQSPGPLPAARLVPADHRGPGGGRRGSGGPRERRERDAALPPAGHFDALVKPFGSTERVPVGPQSWWRTPFFRVGYRGY